MKKLIIVIVALLGILPGMAKTNAEAINYISEISDGVNALCPMTVGENLYLNEMKFNRVKNNLKVTIGINSESFLGIETTPEALDNIARNVVSNWYINGSLREFVEDLGQAGSTVTVGFENRQTGKTQTVNISSNTIRDVIAANPSAEGVLDNQLQTFIEGERKQIGQDLAQGMTLSDVKDRGDFVEFIFICAEPLYSLDMLKSNLTSEAMEGILKDLLSDPAAMLEMRCYSDNGRGVKYTYVGKSSGKRAEGIVSAERLKELTH